MILFYKGVDVPTRHIVESKGTIPFMKAADAKKAIQEMADDSQKWQNETSTRCRSTKTFDGLVAIQAQLNNLRREIKKVNEKVAPAPGFYERNNGNPSYQERRQTIKESLRKFMAESAKRPEENSNLTKEIRASMDTAIKNQGALIKDLELQIGQMRKSISTTIEADTFLVRRIGPSRYVISSSKNKEGLYELKDLDANSIRTTLLNDPLHPKEKDTWSFTLPCIINNLCFNKALADLGASVSAMPFSTYTNLGIGELARIKLIVELADRTVKHPKGIGENVLVEIDKFIFPIDFIVLDMPEDIKTPLIIGRQFLSNAHAKINVFKRLITLRIRNDKVMFKSDKPTINIIKRVYELSLIERIELDLEARLMGEALILNRSLNPLYGDYIKLNDLNKPLELRRNRLMI
uniref:Reverse transcriptase domain-containing protein n=1 Tax=Tanacetum cinerariifolium TaxID=118510 RepID=A0A6L2JPX0_TANCI|nr:hypothetical protein [Tanacetum cinerariifolium]